MTTTDQLVAELDCFGDSFGYLIVLDEKGATYTTQTGGYACNHPFARGWLLPIYPHDIHWTAALYDYFTGPQWGGWCCDGIKQSDVETINRLINVIEAEFHENWNYPLHCRLDTTQLSRCQEAWLYVLIDLPNMVAQRAVLTWENSD